MTIVGYSGNWNVKCEVYELGGSVSVPNNSSTVRVDVYVGRNPNTSTSYYAGNFSGSITVDGQTQTFSGSANERNVSAGEYRYTGVTRDFVVGHNSDGSKVVGVSFGWSAEFSPSSTSGSGSLNLTVIPRKTDCPPLTAIVKTPTSLTISPKAINTFQHSLQIDFGNTSYYVNANGNLQASEYKFPTNITQIPITLPNSFYNNFTTISSSASMILRTYSNNSLVGFSANVLTVTVNQDLCRPYISSYTCSDINQKTLYITNNPNDTIKYASRLQFDIYGYYISDSDDTNTTLIYKTIDSLNYPIPDSGQVTIIEPSINTFMVTLRNSRNITNQSEIKNNGQLIPYIPLTFNIESLKRPEPTTGEIAISYNGNYYAQPFLEEQHGYFEVGDTMSSLNTTINLPDNFYEQMNQNAHHTVFMTGSDYVVADDTTVTTIDTNTIEKSYNLAIYNSDYSSVYIPYEVNVRYTDGVVSSVDVVSNIRIPVVDVGVLSSVDTTNVFYEHIHNTDKDDETYDLMNTLKITWQYREKGSNTWLTGGTLNPTVDDTYNTYSGMETLGNNFDYQKQYEFLFVAEDLLYNSKGDGTVSNPINPIQVQESVSRGLPIFWWGENNVDMIANFYMNGGCFDYSEQEMFTGKYWHDGRKIYKVDKIFEQSTATPSDMQISSSSIANDIDLFTDFYGTVVLYGAFNPPMTAAIIRTPFYNNSTEFCSISYIGGSDYILIRTGSSIQYPKYYIRFEYVKTDSTVSL